MNRLQATHYRNQPEVVMGASEVVERDGSLPQNGGTVTGGWMVLPRNWELSVSSGWLDWSPGVSLQQ